MADVSADLKNWSTTAGSNSPSGSTSLGTGLDDNLREIQKVVRQDLASKGSDIASASTTDLGAVAGVMHDITGTTTVTSFGTVSSGIWKFIKFEGALTLTHNATSLILPGGANITTADGDIGIFFSEGSGNWRCVTYQRAASSPVAYPLSLANGGTGAALVDPNADRILFWDDSAGAVTFLTAGTGLSISGTTISTSIGTTLGTMLTVSGTSAAFTSLPSGIKRITVTFSAFSTNGTSIPVIQLGDSGGYKTSGYLGGADAQASGGGASTVYTNGLNVGRTWDATYSLSGAATFTLMDASTNKWTGTFLGFLDNTGIIFFGATSATLSGTLDRIRVIATNGTDTLDAGYVNIAYDV